MTGTHGTKEPVLGAVTTQKLGPRTSPVTRKTDQLYVDINKLPSYIPHPKVFGVL